MVGQSGLDSGEITIDASKRKDIGYMPQVKISEHYSMESQNSITRINNIFTNTFFQDLNLHMNLTILQTYKFYGLMLDVDMDTIVERAKELETLLDLPPNHLMIETLRYIQKEINKVIYFEQIPSLISFNYKFN